VRAFVDLSGASGATYRFRLAPDGQVTTPMAGNYACLRQEPGGFTVVSVAATNDLSSATTDWKRVQAKQGATHLYIRLNVSAAIRETEQRDIAAHYRLRAGRRTA
jgi:hypothetical protein